MWNEDSRGLSVGFAIHSSDKLPAQHLLVGAPVCCVR